MPLNQNQVRNLSIATVSAAALVGRPTEVAHIQALDGWFRYDTAVLTADGVNIIPASGGFWVRVQQPLKQNLSAVVAPAASDDSALGYVVGSLWVNTLLDNTYVCVDATAAAAAIWHQIDRAVLLDNLAAIIAPVATDGITLGYAVGSVWIDTVANKSYICVDSTIAAAIWVETSPQPMELNNYAAVVAPTATNDAGTGYAVGSVWIDTVANKSYTCVDSTIAAAIWVETSPAAALLDNYAAIVAPVVTDDSAAGYAIGSHWVDTLTNQAYICVDSTAGAAVWDNTSGVDNPTAAVHDVVALTATTLVGTAITVPTVALGVSAPAFNLNKVIVMVNGIALTKGVDALWVSASTLSVTIDLYAGDTVTVIP